MSGESAVAILSTLEIGSKEIHEIVETNKSVFTQILNESTKLTNESTNRVQACNQVFDQIYSQVTKINQMVKEITIATQEQSRGVREASKAVHVISDASSRTSQNSKHSKDVASSLWEQSQALNRLVDRLNSLMTGSNDADKAA